MSKPQGPAADAFPCPAKTGFLNKEGGSGFWQKRWMVLDHHYLFYYKAKDSKHPQNDVCLADYDRCIQMPDCKKSPYAFQLSSSQITNDGDTLRSYLMYADSEAEMHEWIAAIQCEMNPGGSNTSPERSTTPNKSLALTKSPSPLEDKSADNSSRGNKHLKPGGSILTRFRGGGGSKKDKKEPKPTPVQVDGESMNVISAEANAGTPLVHLTADRSKGQQGRRPPTRQRRVIDAGVAPTNIFAGREVASDRAEPPSKRPKPTPPPKALKPGESSPGTRTKLAMKPPSTGSRDKGSNNAPSPKPAPRNPRTPAKPVLPKTNSGSSVSTSALPAVPVKPKPIPRSRTRTETTKTTNPEAALHTAKSIKEENTETTEINLADGVQDELTGKDENQSSIDLVKMEVEEEGSETNSKLEEERETKGVENDKSGTLNEHKKEQEQLPEDKTKGETVSNSLNTAAASANIEGESGSGELAEELGFEVVHVEEVKDSERDAYENQDTVKDQAASQDHNELKNCAVSENPVESESCNQSVSHEDTDQAATDQAVSEDRKASTNQSLPENPMISTVTVETSNTTVSTVIAAVSEEQGRKKSEVKDEVKAKRKSLVQETGKECVKEELKKRNSEVLKHRHSKEVKTNVESKGSMTDNEPVKCEDQEQVKSEEKQVVTEEPPKPLDSDQQVELAASKLRALSSSPVQTASTATLNGPDSADICTADVVSILQSATDPKTALDKAKEILRQAHKANIDAERARREAVLERELAKQERAEAEMKKKNATEILRLARAALSSIKK
ncbi:PH domain-containing protein DDB_G0287875-like isoform X2 [Corticium candelabrum]|uniref:PH domain-containing protein DDB_G0287875-like isoform X2 n=1 Tax=Corticium candelabrum TaxID=121492 RepID=UPI002E266379|nr:PH domain-containing protein DDB_G0287875-like isoform X2 [Corticium candelabrum]